jgi:hypothetical protein
VVARSCYTLLNGGKLYQDVDGHNGPHAMWDVNEKEFIQNVSSVHHQMCMDNKEGGMEILGFLTRHLERWLNAKEVEQGGQQSDIEAFFYRDTCCFGVQGHPEYAGYTHGTRVVFKQIDSTSTRTLIYHIAPTMQVPIAYDSSKN